MEKVGDAYNRALDQFTEALSNKGDMVDAWDNVGYVHLRLGAYAEAVDDYNHVLALKPELLEAIEHRGEAYLAIDRLDDAKIAYMDLFNHAPTLADQLMLAMQKWLDRASRRRSRHARRRRRCVRQMADGARRYREANGVAAALARSGLARSRRLLSASSSARSCATSSSRRVSR